MKSLPLLLCTAAAVVAAPVSAGVQKDAVRGSIKKALDESAAAWSAGDLAKFMQLYEHSPSTRYINSKGMTIGYEAIQAMYASRFPNGKASHMGRLSLELIDAQQVGPEYVFVVGRYHLKPDTGPTVSGITTLLFHKVDQQWLILVDHTS